MSRLNLDNLTNLLKMQLAYFGMNEWVDDFFSVDYVPAEDTIEVNLTKEWKIPRVRKSNESETAKKFEEIILDSIDESLINSSWFKDYKYRMALMQDQIDAHERKIQELKKFETYYNMNFKMRHGEPTEEEKIAEIYG